MKFRRVYGWLALLLSLTVLSACAQHAARTAASDRTDADSEAAGAHEVVGGFVEGFVQSLEAELEAPVELDDRQRESLRCLGRSLVDELPLDALQMGDSTPQEVGEAEISAGLEAEFGPATVDAIVRRAGPCQFMSAMAGLFVEVALHKVEVELGDAEFVSDRTRRCLGEQFATDTTMFRALIEIAAGVQTLDENGQQFNNFLIAGCPGLLSESILRGLELQAAQDGIDLVFGESAQVCFEGVLTRDDALANALEGFNTVTGKMTDSSEASFNDALNEAIVSCPAVFTSLVVSGLESEGLSVSDAEQACLTRELTLRPEVLGAALKAEEELPLPMQEVLLACGL